MKSTTRNLIAIVIVGAILIASVLALSRGARNRANMRSNPPVNLTKVTINDFTTIKMAPTAAEVAAHKAAGAPSHERSLSASRIARVVNAKYVPKDMAAQLVPLRDWEQRQADLPAGHPQHRGNVFLVRQSRYPYVVQVTEGLGFVMVDVSRIDGAELAKPGADLAAFAVTTAARILTREMQPRPRQIHTSTKWKPHGVTWVTRDAPHPGDHMGLVYGIVFAHTDGTYLRYEVQGYLTRSAMAFQPPAPYTFGAPPAPPRPIRLR